MIEVHCYRKNETSVIETGKIKITMFNILLDIRVCKLIDSLHDIIFKINGKYIGAIGQLNP